MRLSSVPVGQVWRFLAVGAINTLVGYALYALMVAIGLQLFLAQMIATIIAVAFNYVTYSRHVFSGAPPSRLRFLLSYALNYLVGLAALALSATMLRSPYLAGLLATLLAAIVNFVVLRRFVFASRADRSRDREMPTPSRTPRSEKIDHVHCG